jgi:transcriptional antiterminator RfaH
MGNNERNWYLVYTKPRMEAQAEENLNRQGYETYLPRYLTTRRRNGRYHKIVEPCFPRYLFIHLDTRTDNWAPIRSTVGVVKMVEFEGLPAVVPGELITTLRNNEDTNGIQQIQELDLKAGDKVTIVEGPFAVIAVSTSNNKVVNVSSYSWTSSARIPR